jgi:TATA-box binding protein (TBP) (component of TFIID and TFIIIB)
MDKANKFQQKLNELRPDSFYLSTMTVCVSVRNITPPIDLKKVLENISKTDEFTTYVTGSTENIQISNKRHFHNALVFKCQNIITDFKTTIKKAAVKVFCNGKMHITGVKSPIEAIYLADVFSSYIDITLGGDGISNVFAIDDYDIQMINFCTKTPPPNSHISLQGLFESLKQNLPFYCTYNTDKHPGVIMKAPNFNFIFFESGSVMVSLSDIDNLPEASRYLEDIFKSYITQPINSAPRKKQKRQKNFDYNAYLVLK